jgi:hypothetical protein
VKQQTEGKAGRTSRECPPQGADESAGQQSRARATAAQANAAEAGPSSPIQTKSIAVNRRSTRSNSRFRSHGPRNVD